ncbi:zinc finger protein 318-like isoform X2 [Erinaceus europaeus]|uniref:Zinc finger protein 318-like isoform X2 n=1 Tax=Erinaceus europaeus TaxID=9365 RepID=A0ABM3XAF6_ERIEU|nr:zinc finger protein 318-like isoform X2 [Erinaceus europaeus]
MAESKAATSEQGSHFAVRGSGGRRQFVGGRGRRGSNQRGSFPVRGAHDGNGPWQQWPRQQRRPSSRGPRRPRAGTAGGALHRPEDGSEGESHPECSSGAPSPSRGRGRRPRRPRADMGHRGRRSPPAPPRGCIFYRFPPPLARLLPRPSRAGFRARRRGVSRADFARYVREDPFEDSGHETEGELQRERQREKEKQHSTASPLMKFPLPVVLPCGGQGLEPRSSQMTQSPGLRYDSLDHTLRITVGNNYFRGNRTDDSAFNQSSKCTQHLERLIFKEGPLNSFLSQHDKGCQTREISLHSSNSSPHMNCHDELLRRTEQNRDKLEGSYHTQPEERSPEAKRPRYGYDDTEKMHSMGEGHPGFTSRTGNNQQFRQSSDPKILDPQFQELNLAQQNQEEGERKVDVSDTSCFKSELSDTQPRSAPVHSLHRPEEVSVIPKKLTLKKEVEVDMEPSVQLDSSSSNTNCSQHNPIPSGHPSLPLSGATANSPFREKFGSSLCHADKLEMASEEPMQSTDDLLPHEIAIQDGSGFSRILSMFSDSTSTRERGRLSFSDIEDEEKFLYGEEEKAIKVESSPRPLADSSLPAIKLEPTERSNPESAKIHELVKSMGLGNLVAELSKMAECTHQQQLPKCKDEPHDMKSTGNLNHQHCEMKAPPLNQKPKWCFFCKKPEH